MQHKISMFKYIVACVILCNIYITVGFNNSKTQKWPQVSKNPIVKRQPKNTSTTRISNNRLTLKNKEHFAHPSHHDVLKNRLNKNLNDEYITEILQKASSKYNINQRRKIKEAKKKLKKIGDGLIKDKDLLENFIPWPKKNFHQNLIKKQWKEEPMSIYNKKIYRINKKKNPFPNLSMKEKDIFGDEKEFFTKEENEDNLKQTVRYNENDVTEPIEENTATTCDICEMCHIINQLKILMQCPCGNKGRSKSERSNYVIQREYRKHQKEHQVESPPISKYISEIRSRNRKYNITEPDYFKVEEIPSDQLINLEDTSEESSSEDISKDSEDDEPDILNLSNQFKQNLESNNKKKTTGSVSKEKDDLAIFPPVMLNKIKSKYFAEIGEVLQTTSEMEYSTLENGHFDDGPQYLDETVTLAKSSTESAENLEEKNDNDKIFSKFTTEIFDVPQYFPKGFKSRTNTFEVTEDGNANSEPGYFNKRLPLKNRPKDFENEGKNVDNETECSHRHLPLFRITNKPHFYKDELLNGRTNIFHTTDNDNSTQYLDRRLLLGTIDTSETTEDSYSEYGPEYLYKNMIFRNKTNIFETTDNDSPPQYLDKRLPFLRSSVNTVSSDFDKEALYFNKGQLWKSKTKLFETTDNDSPQQIFYTSLPFHRSTSKTTEENDADNEALHFKKDSLWKSKTNIFETTDDDTMNSASQSLDTRLPFFRSTSNIFKTTEENDADNVKHALHFKKDLLLRNRMKMFEITDSDRPSQSSNIHLPFLRNTPDISRAIEVIEADNETIHSKKGSLMKVKINTLETNDKENALKYFIKHFRSTTDMMTQSNADNEAVHVNKGLLLESTTDNFETTDLGTIKQPLNRRLSFITSTPYITETVEENTVDNEQELDENQFQDNEVSNITETQVNNTIILEKSTPLMDNTSHPPETSESSKVDNEPTSSYEMLSSPKNKSEIKEETSTHYDLTNISNSTRYLNTLDDKSEGNDAETEDIDDTLQMDSSISDITETLNQTIASNISKCLGKSTLPYKTMSDDSNTSPNHVRKHMTTSVSSIKSLSSTSEIITSASAKNAYKHVNRSFKTTIKSMGNVSKCLKESSFFFNALENTTHKYVSKSPNRSLKSTKMRKSTIQIPNVTNAVSKYVDKKCKLTTSYQRKQTKPQFISKCAIKSSTSVCPSIYNSTLNTCNTTTMGSTSICPSTSKCTTSISITNRYFQNKSSNTKTKSSSTKLKKKKNLIEKKMSAVNEIKNETKSRNQITSSSLLEKKATSTPFSDKKMNKNDKKKRKNKKKILSLTFRTNNLLNRIFPSKYISELLEEEDSSSKFSTNMIETNNIDYIIKKLNKGEFEEDMSNNYKSTTIDLKSLLETINKMVKNPELKIQLRKNKELHKLTNLKKPTTQSYNYSYQKENVKK